MGSLALAISLISELNFNYILTRHIMRGEKNGD